MFNSISWESFLTTIGSLAGAYYFITTLMLYHQEITQWWKNKFNSSRIEESESVVEQTAIMGKVENTPSSPSNPLVHTASVVTEKDVLIGSVSDLLQEIKSLIQLAIENNWDKAQSESLFRALLIRYPTLKNTTHQQSVSSFMADTTSEECSFALTTEEVMTWWE